MVSSSSGLIFTENQTVPIDKRTFTARHDAASYETGIVDAAILSAASTESPPLPATLTNPIRTRINDPDDVDDPLKQTVQQSQQVRLPPVSASPPSAARTRTAERTPPLESQQPQTHIEAASAGVSPPRVRFAPQAEQSGHQHPALESETLPASPGSYPPGYSRPSTRRRPSRVSRDTAAAIQYTLEEALRQPHQFTRDFLEENASMSDLTGGGPSASAGNGRTAYNNGSSRPNPPAPTGSPVVRGPRAIMEERAARDARRRAEQELAQMERARVEEEQRLFEEDRTRSAERRAAAAGATSGGAGGSGGDGQGVLRNSDNSQRSGERVQGSGNTGARPQDQPIQGRGTGGRALGGGDAVPATGRRPSRARQPAGQAEAGPSTNPNPPEATQQPEASTGARRPTQSSFPHAFERWETLSAHWEGLTSFWMRRLQENSTEIQRDPVSAQLARQVTDLSAAGANLFHAVVELQRLRASSERKFQRWFHDTRQEQERAREMQAMLENSLQEERQGRAEAIADAVARESDRSNSDKLLAEMKRELQISKEEARRAWEELGRREQEERERTMSLREGQPTSVGGVQVVPMMQGAPSRHGSGAQSRYHPGAESESVSEQDVRRQLSDPPASSAERQTTYQPSTGRSAPPFESQAPAVQPPSGPFYQQQHGVNLHSADSETGTFSDDGEYEIDEQGQFRRDARGNKIRYQDPVSDDDTDEYDVSPEQAREAAHLRKYGHAPASTSSYGASATASSSRPVAVTNAEQGATRYTAPSWAAAQVHDHPTRLSDVIEEDERSRTSASIR